MPPIERTSHGPLLNMPIFASDGQEIMSVQDLGGDFITIYTEDADEPGKLNSSTLYRTDYEALLKSQSQGYEE